MPVRRVRLAGSAISCDEWALGFGDYVMDNLLPEGSGGGMIPLQESVHVGGISIFVNGWDLPVVNVRVDADERRMKPTS